MTKVRVKARGPRGTLLFQRAGQDSLRAYLHAGAGSYKFQAVSTGDAWQGVISATPAADVLQLDNVPTLLQLWTALDRIAFQISGGASWDSAKAWARENVSWTRKVRK